VQDLVEIGLSNAVAACFLALIAALVGRLARRPALTHALWLLVLAKLITPPLLTLHIPWSMPRPAMEVGEEQVKAPVNATEPDSDEHLVSTFDSAEKPEPEKSNDESDGPAEACVFSHTQPEFEPPDQSLATTRAPETAEAATPFDWQTSLTVVWLVGAGFWFGLASIRVLKFHLLLRTALQAKPALQKQTDALACQLGLRTGPGVWLVPGFLSPMLWAFGGRACLILPAGLLGRLSEEQRATLLLHELAHLRRQDHWVRLLEVIVTGLFWWHPVLWWARREIREAEEQCCDAWVVWAMPDRARGYALTLLETVDFLSEARPSLPPVASGIGYVHDLQRRLTMIMRGTTPRGLSWCGALAVIGLAALLLPALPKLDAQDNPFGGEGQEQRAREEEAAKAKAQVDAARAHLEQAMAQLKQAQQQADQAKKQAAEQFQRAKANLNEFQAKLRQEEADAKIQGRVRVRQELHQDVLAEKTCQRCHGDGKIKEGNMDPSFQKSHDAAIQLTAELKKLHEATENTGRKLKEVLRAMDRESQGKGERRSDAQPGGPRARNVPERRDPESRANPDSDPRMHELEMKMEKIMAELQALRQEMQGRRPERRESRPDPRPGTQPTPRAPGEGPRGLAPSPVGPDIITPPLPAANPIAPTPPPPAGKLPPASPALPPGPGAPAPNRPGSAAPPAPLPPGGENPPDAPGGAIGLPPAGGEPASPPSSEPPRPPATSGPSEPGRP